MIKIQTVFFYRTQMYEKNPFNAQEKQNFVELLFYNIQLQILRNYMII